MANLVPLFEEALEFQDYNGTVLSNGKAAVYYIGRTRLADIYNDVAAEYPAENPRILNNLGMGPVYVNPAFDYELVVFDAYDNELFSVKKYIHSKGEHSTANVVVTPSESIAVSAWTVGDVQVYMPYLTGQLGKVYTGIEPIVVNNVEDKISAQHVPLGVQDPLYFVQDDEEGCIIGIDSSACGKTYSGISPILVDNTANTISITGTIGKDWTEEILSAANDASAAATAWTDSQGYLTGVDLSEYAKTDFVISAIDSSTSGLLPTSAFATASGSFITALPDDLVYTGDITGLATTAQLDEKLEKSDSANFLLTSDSANFYPMNSNPSGYLTGLPSDLATTGWVDSQGYLTAVNIPESAVWNATTQTVSANSAQWAGGTANPQIPVTGINGIKISESGDKVVFEVSGDYYPGNNPSGFITGVDLSDYATTAQVSEKLDTTAFSTVSGDFLQSDDITGKQDITGMTAYQPVGSYLTTADSANFYTTANPSGFITGVDLTPYQTTAGMTAYANSADVTGTAQYGLTTAGWSEITAGGGTVPTGIMVESGLEYDNTEISGYSGSAFKDVALTDVVTANSGAWGGNAIPVSAGEGVKVDYTNGMLVFKQDRTLLYSGNTQVTGFTASEPLTNFERVEFIVSPDPNSEGPSIITYPMININTARLNLGSVGNFNGWRNISWNYLFNTNDNIVYTAKSGSYFGLDVNGATAQGTWGSATLWLFEINGINRKV